MTPTDDDVERVARAIERVDYDSERDTETVDYRAQARAAIAAMTLPLLTVRPIDEWHEDHGAALWWRFPIVEPPYSGTPLDDDFPDYLTHWSPIPEVKTP